MKGKKRISTLLIFIFATCFLCSSCTTVGRAHRIRIDGQIKSADDIKIKTSDEIFYPGEKMTFKIKWLGIPVGIATLETKGKEVIRGKEVYRLELTAKTNKALSAIFPVRDRYVSYMDSQDLCTLRHEVDRKEGFYRKQAYTDFYQDEHFAFFKNLLDGSEKKFEIPDKTQDTLTALYYLRTLNLKLGDTITYNVVNSEKNYIVHGNITRKDFIKIKNLGIFDAVLIKPYAEVEGKKTTRGSAIGYFSADKRRLPLLTTLRSYLFTKIVITLIDYKEGREE